MLMGRVFVDDVWNVTDVCEGVGVWTGLCCFWVLGKGGWRLVSPVGLARCMVICLGECNCRVGGGGMEVQKCCTGVVCVVGLSGGRGVFGGTTLAPRPETYSPRHFLTNLSYTALLCPWRGA